MSDFTDMALIGLLTDLVMIVISFFTGAASWRLFKEWLANINQQPVQITNHRTGKTVTISGDAKGAELNKLLELVD